MLDHGVSKTHVSFRTSFQVVYLGYAVLDGRYTMPMLPWIIAEIKRHGRRNPAKISLEVAENTLRAISAETGSVAFEHKLSTVSKFAQSSQDSSCFTYVTKEVADGPSAYHVFQTMDENSVLELFSAIRERSKEMSSQRPLAECGNRIAAASFGSSCQQYEVLYLGRIKVAGKRAPPTFVDDAVEKFRILEKSRCRRQKHGSATSLPQCVEADESRLGKRARAAREEDPGSSSSGVSSCESISNTTSSDNDLPLFRIQSLVPHSQSMDFVTSARFKSEIVRTPDSLMPPASLIPHTQSLDAPSSAEIVKDLCDIEGTRVRSCSGDVPRNKQVSLPIFQNRSESGFFSELRRPRAYTSPLPGESRQGNRTMLFLIGQMEICLIGTDQKQVLLTKTFADIAHCLQGVKHLDHFGFICRETTLAGSDTYCGYIFRCETERVVNEMMQTLKLAFRRAHQIYQRVPEKHTDTDKVVFCSSCPMHWFHTLCSDVEGMLPEDAHLVILRNLGLLPDSEKEDIIVKLQNSDYDNMQEENEILMILLRNLCEQKQLSHSHVVNNVNMNKNDSKSLKEKSSKLDSFREKAKKSLHTSIDAFLKFTNRDETKEPLDHLTAKVPARSETIGDYDTRSYREGSCDEHSASDKLSPVETRPRSSTFTSTRDIQNKKPKEAAPPINRPIISMLYKVANKSPFEIENEDKGSWRQRIFHRVQSMQDHDTQSSSLEDSSDQDWVMIEQSKPRKRTKEEFRQLWKKAIMEQILLIRMEKENKKLQVNQDAATHKRMKLNYEEVTPCIMSTAADWDHILSEADTPISHKKLAEMVKIGVSRHKRGEIWQFLAAQNPSFQNRADLEFEPNNVPYQELLKQLTAHQHSILIDIGRTFPSHPFFSQTLGSGQLALFNILKAFSLLDKDVGYCQGLSFVAGILLLHMSEEQTFSMMKFLMFNLGLRNQYKTDMMAFQIQMYQLSRLIHDNHRDLYDHFERYDIGSTLYAAPWFLTLFASQFPIGFVARLFDLIFLNGTDVVFKVSLVLLANYKEYILNCDSFESTMNFLKTTLPSIDTLQMEIIFNQVFSLDISSQLHAYGVEYQVLVEEVPASKGSAHLDDLRATNKVLKAQNIELMEQLQVCHSRIHSLEASDASLRSTVHRLEHRISALEDEKEALGYSMRVMKSRLERLEVERVRWGGAEGEEGRTPPFGMVYAMSEREEEEQFRSVMRDFCLHKSFSSEDECSNSDQKISTCIVEEDGVFEDSTELYETF